MLASIRGTVIQKSDFSVVIECNGFGVEALVSRRAADLCKTGEQTFLYTYLQISDAGIALYGFADETERRLFKLMILTKGVGGKVAVSVLQCLSPADIIAAVESNDPKMLTTVPGIGKKTAERLMLELRDRLEKWASSQNITGVADAQGVEDAGTVDNGENSKRNQEMAIQAMLDMGYNRKQAESLVKQVFRPELTLAQIISEALKATCGGK